MKEHTKLAERFDEKGYNLYEFFVPIPPIFDPSYMQLLNHTKKEAYEKFKKDYKYAFDAYESSIEHLNTWIDHQNYK